MRVAIALFTLLCLTTAAGAQTFTYEVKPPAITQSDKLFEDAKQLQPAQTLSYTPHQSANEKQHRSTPLGRDPFITVCILGTLGALLILGARS